MHEVYGTQDNFYFMLDAAMRYALGRNSYDVGLIANFIKDNLFVFNEKWLVNIINDIKWYLDDRTNGKIDDDDCDCQIWLNLRKAVRDEYRSPRVITWWTGLGWRSKTGGKRYPVAQNLVAPKLRS